MPGLVQVYCDGLLLRPDGFVNIVVRITVIERTVAKIVEDSARYHGGGGLQKQCSPMYKIPQIVQQLCKLLRQK